MVVKCPDCKSKKLVKRGFQILANFEKKQRYTCKSCGLNFSDKKTISTGYPE